MAMRFNKMDIRSREAIESEYRELSNTFMNNRLSEVEMNRMCDLEAIMEEWYN